MWLEREVVSTSDQMGRVVSRDLVYSNEYGELIDANTRVIWVSGAIEKSSNPNRYRERLVADMTGDSKAAHNTVSSFEIGVHGQDVNAVGKMVLEKFTANPKDRFYVEFLNNTSMTEKGVNDFMAAWKKLLPQLRAKGLNASNVVMGGAKYNQATNAIMMVKVGD
ncbi:MAG: hypothetical protein HKUEN02_22420 [Anaerolineaceae bacterium]|nr:MAG: hypothetical protein HKUEN02_22420 [Anaerolineaceae bacterium]